MKLVLGLLVSFAVLSIAVAAGWTAPLDQAVMTVVVGHRTGLFNNIAVNVSALGSAPVVSLIVLLVTSYALVSRRQRIVLALLWTPLSFLLDDGMKVLFQHPRPTEAIIAIPDSYGYPSGHAVAASALYITLALIAGSDERRQRPRRLLLLSGMTVTVLVAWSRIYLGVHYLSDVVGGLLLGGAGAVTTVLVLSRTDSDQLAAPPSGR